MSMGRQFQILYLLLEHGRMTAGELGRRLEVSPRTVLRDIDALSSAGVPVYAAQGQGGGVALMDGYTLDRAAFSQDEQRLLLSALQSLPAQEGAQTLQKLSALFGRGEEAWLRVELTRWGAAGEDSEKFLLLKRAILERRQLRFAYASAGGGLAPRLVLPGRLVFKGRAWYLQALDLEREDWRTFRLSRMLDPRLTGEVFHQKLQPPEIEPAGELPPLFRLAVRLRFAPQVAYRVYDEFDRRCVSPCDDGSLLVEAVIPDDGWICGYLLSFGTGVEVLSPPSLRRQLGQLAQKISDTHRKPDTPCPV